MTDEEAVEETPAVDDMREQLLNELSQNLGDILVESHLRPHEDVWLRVRIDAWQDAAMISKNSGFEYFGFLSAIGSSINGSIIKFIPFNSLGEGMVGIGGAMLGDATVTV